MANYDSCPERRSQSKDKAGEADKARALIKVGPRRLAQIKAQAQDKVMAVADGAAVAGVETRTSDQGNAN